MPVIIDKQEKGKPLIFTAEDLLAAQRRGGTRSGLPTRYELDDSAESAIAMICGMNRKAFQADVDAGAYETIIKDALDFEAILMMLQWRHAFLVGVEAGQLIQQVGTS